jgi:hypothetical protein
MRNKAQHIITARLPEALGIRLKKEAADNLCSSSDVIRRALLSFFGPDCLTIKADPSDKQEVTK